MSDSKATKPRRLGARKKQDIVCQMIGRRAACLELLQIATQPEIVEALMDMGKWTDEQIVAHDGMYFTSFEKSARAVLDAK